MKKVFLLGIACLVLSVSADAQTFSEWFQQKKTQRKYLLQQIAALQVYIGYAKEGYEIAGKGTNTIRAIKKGDFSLHDEFIAALNKTSPKISRYAKVADIITAQQRILRQTSQTVSVIKKANQFTEEELRQLQSAIESLLADCTKSIDLLLAIIIDSELQMNDAARLKHIDKLYLDMQAKFTFSTAFTNEAKMLSLQRLSDRAGIDYSKRLNGFK